MTRIKSIGLVLVAVAVMSAVAVASASAEPPEADAKGGKEVIKTGFTIKSEKSKLEAKGGAKITCTEDSGSGKLTGPQTGEAKIKFTGCEAALGGKCNTGGAAAGEVVIELSMKLVYLDKTNKEIAYLFSILPLGSTVEIKCGAVVVDLLGTFLIPVGPVNKPQLKYTLVAKQKEGKQEPLEYEKEPGVKAKNTLEVEVNGAKAEQAGFEGTEKFTFEEEIEFRA